MRRSLIGMTLLGVCAASATSALAQTGQRWSMQGSGLFAALEGDAFQGFKDGFGGELQVRLTPSALSFGGGLQLTLHGTTGEGSDILTDVRLLGFFFEPRYVLDVGSSVMAPYLSGRFAYSKMSFTLGGLADDPGISMSIDEPWGPTINGGGGVLVRLSSRANLDVGVTYGYTRFDDITISATNTANGASVSIPFEVGSGQNWVARIGLAIGLGN
jgi:hypothetical protein